MTQDWARKMLGVRETGKVLREIMVILTLLILRKNLILLVTKIAFYILQYLQLKDLILHFHLFSIRLYPKVPSLNTLLNNNNKNNNRTNFQTHKAPLIYLSQRITTVALHNNHLHRRLQNQYLFVKITYLRITTFRKFLTRRRLS